MSESALIRVIALMQKLALSAVYDDFVSSEDLEKAAKILEDHTVEIMKQHMRLAKG